ncbi:hypothetical protein [Fodinicola feengrottensis]|uniref:hypothetical protein n=1 Tax=Fodinicola feengrottensis TaxID=435914 RepID=UPI0013D231BD|nr:hypothetical protein [Fodinicola feengrottensis]
MPVRAEMGTSQRPRRLILAIAKYHPLMRVVRWLVLFFLVQGAGCCALYWFASPESGIPTKDTANLTTVIGGAMMVIFVLFSSFRWPSLPRGAAE